MKMDLTIKKSYLFFPLTATFFGLILAIDQLLLPMFHFMGLPFKVSYFLAGFWFVDFLIKKERDNYLDGEFKTFCAAILVIVMCSIFGELFFSIFWSVDNLEPFIRSILIYVLTVLAFGLGLASTHFNMRWLISILLISISLNFAFIFLKFQLPTALIDLYYGAAVVNDFAALGLNDAQSIIEMSRPRGLFPNPNGSAFLVNIISLFIYLGIRHKLCIAPTAKTYFLIILAPVVLSMLLASRGEFIVASILAVLHYRNQELRVKRHFLLLASSMALVGVFVSASVLQKIDIDEIQNNIERTLSVIDMIANASSDTDQQTRELSSIARPLQVFLPAYQRFKISPIFGSGFSRVAGHEYFQEGTDYFHNDWFRILVSSGIIGLVAMLFIINRFILFLGWPVLIPFVLPGVVNSFLLNIPAVMFFFFMIGYMRSKLKRARPSDL